MTIHLLITGDVTGVGYRAWMKRTADSFEIKGWVRNGADGVVEGVIQGDNNTLDRFTDLCKKGPETAWVERIEIRRIEESKEYKEFKIR